MRGWVPATNDEEAEGVKTGSNGVLKLVSTVTIVYTYMV
jgi:hypothetical protein